METITCTYESTRFSKAGDPSDNGYRVVEYNNKSNNEVFTAIGYYLGELDNAEYVLHGIWKTTKYGKQFAIQSFEEKIVPNKKGITSFLQTLKGCGEKTADAIYEVCGTQTLSLLATEPDRVLKMMHSSAYKKLLSEKKFAKLMESYTEKRGAQEAITLLSPFGISPKICVKLFNIYGAETGNIIKTNPYTLIEVKGIGFLKADEIAKSMGIPRTSKSRIKACLYHVLYTNEVNGFTFNGETISGSTCLPKMDLLRITKELLNTPEITDSQISVAAMELLNEGKIKMAMDHIYRQKTYLAEKQIAQCLVNINTNFVAKEFFDADSLIDEAEDALDIELDAKQREAVANSLSAGVSVITGGPGTGKTMTLKVFAYCYKKINPKCSIKFLAPTGKAARRISESTGEEASTIHRALEIFNSEELSTDDKELDEDLIIVDECSMLDTWVAAALLNSIKSGGQLLLVGDIDQLESVGCGAILRDLIASGIVTVTMLEKIFRQKGKNLIALNSAKIRKGNSALEKGDEFAFIKADDIASSAKLIVKAYLQSVKEYGLDNVIALCPFRKRTDTSVEALNILLQEELNPLNGRNELKHGAVSYRVNDRVMALKNSENVANGETGVVTTIDLLEKTVTVDFNSIKVTYSSDELDELSHAYAVSIHKSQGSEYQCVITTFMMAHKVMLKRNLLYTAITRAKKKCIIVGQAYAIKCSIDTVSTNKRITLLQQMLKYYDSVTEKIRLLNSLNKGKP